MNTKSRFQLKEILIFGFFLCRLFFLLLTWHRTVSDILYRDMIINFSASYICQRDKMSIWLCRALLLHDSIPGGSVWNQTRTRPPSRLSDISLLDFFFWEVFRSLSLRCWHVHYSLHLKRGILAQYQWNSGTFVQNGHTGISKERTITRRRKEEEESQKGLGPHFLNLIFLT